MHAESMTALVQGIVLVTLLFPNKEWSWVLGRCKDSAKPCTQTKLVPVECVVG